jgi:hypothetical protein
LPPSELCLVSTKPLLDSVTVSAMPRSLSRAMVGGGRSSPSAYAMAVCSRTASGRTIFREDLRPPSRGGARCER